MEQVSVDDSYTKWIASLMRQQHHDLKPTDVLSVQVTGAVPKGENYTSIVKRVKLSILTASGARKTFSVIVKEAKTDGDAKKVLGSFAVFRGETKMYAVVLKHMEALMEEFEDKRDTLWANYYGCVPYETMALEDLKVTGFTLMDRTAWLGLDYALLVLRSLGRYHAMTKVLLSRALIGGVEDQGTYFASKGNPIAKPLFGGALEILSQAMLKKAGSWTSGWEALAERVAKQKDEICQSLETLYHDYDKKFDFLCHGDMWTSNMMFKVMEYTGIPIAVKFLDYQIPHLNSFMWDVCYFMHTSVKPSIRRANKRKLLEAYHESLADNLRFFNFEGYKPTLEDVINEEKRLLPAGFAFITCILPITSATTNEAFVFEKLITGTAEEVFNRDAFSEEKFVREIGDDLKEFAAIGII